MIYHGIGKTVRSSDCLHFTPYPGITAHKGSSCHQYSPDILVTQGPLTQSHVTGRHVVTSRVRLLLRSLLSTGRPGVLVSCSLWPIAASLSRARAGRLLSRLRSEHGETVTVWGCSAGGSAGGTLRPSGGEYHTMNISI